MSLHEIYGEANAVHQTWKTSSEYRSENLNISAEKFEEVTSLLLERPNLNSTHLFRADILFDSLGWLKTVFEKEQALHASSPKFNGTTPDHIGSTNSLAGASRDTAHDAAVEAPHFDGFELQRTVVRKLIPRNPQLHEPLIQSCFTYTSASNSGTDEEHVVKHLVVYVQHVILEQDTPWYHPKVKAIAYLFERDQNPSKLTTSTLSVHYKPFDPSSLNDNNGLEQNTQTVRFHRIFVSLLRTFIRLSKLDSPPEPMVETTGENVTPPPKVSDRSLTPSALKDTILPQHVVQDTYTRLKQAYASNLMNKWVENTEPSKHVYEDLAIAAFLIELWKHMYAGTDFPGFVDFACGNGVLVYVLIQEGYRGYGYDARRRKTWTILGIDEHLEEQICIPEPFMSEIGTLQDLKSSGLNVHNGIFEPGTFIIANHADELVPWTPLLAALADPSNPLPYLAIPCCSHALSGARKRYNVKDIDNESTLDPTTNSSKHDDEDPQDSKGDLRALRAQKLKASTHATDQSQYACLTKKVIALAEEIGQDVETTLMRIPSTRNIGIVGNRRKVMSQTASLLKNGEISDKLDGSAVLQTVQTILERECKKEGGMNSAAKIWYERARKLQGAGARGKVNLGSKPTPVLSSTSARDDALATTTTPVEESIQNEH